MPPDLSRRRRQPELMDDPDLDPATHRSALAGLGRLHRVARSDRILWRPLRELLAGGRPISVLDLACGGGDLAVSLARRARAAGLPLTVAGCDRSPLAVERATAHAARAGVEATFEVADILSGPLPRRPDGEPHDVYTCSLFLHHLEERQAIAALTAMRESARIAVLAHDLLRSRSGWLLAWLASRLLTRSHVVRTDALLSVQAAFSYAEVGFLTGQAGMHRNHTAIVERWPARVLVDWRRPGS